MNNFEKIDGLLDGVRTIGMAGHVHPDGDCVGSSLGLYNYIKDNYPDIDVRLYLEPIPNIFKFMKRSEEIKNEYTDEIIFDMFVTLDCGDTGRLGHAVKYFEHAKKTVCIDHHVSNQAFAEYNYIFPDASSTCELIYQILDQSRITKEIAECLYTGIVHDTGVFQYSCTSSETMRVAGILMDKGIDYSGIIDRTFYEKTYNQNRIMGYVLMNSRLYFDGKCIVGFVTADEMKKFDVLPKHLEGIVSQLRVTKDVEIAVFLYENPDGTFKVSFRSAKDMDVAELAVKFGGGGHVKAAGCTMEGKPEEIIGILLEEIKKRL